MVYQEILQAKGHRRKDKIRQYVRLQKELAECQQWRRGKRTK